MKHYLCFLVTCPHLPPVPHLILNFIPQSNNTDNISFGTIVRFQCEPGYYLSGHEISKCTNNGKWIMSIVLYNISN